MNRTAERNEWTYRVSLLANPAVQLALCSCFPRISTGIILADSITLWWYWFIIILPGIDLPFCIYCVAISNNFSKNSIQLSNVKNCYHQVNKSNAEYHSLEADSDILFTLEFHSDNFTQEWKSMNFYRFTANVKTYEILNL